MRTTLSQSFDNDDAKSIDHVQHKAGDEADETDDGWPISWTKTAAGSDVRRSR
jgi:hypothetical protein